MVVVSIVHPASSLLQKLYLYHCCFYCQAGIIPPQDSLSQVHKQADLKRALKMYSVISDGEDGRSRTPSPSENNNEPPYTSLFENTARCVCMLS